MTWHMSQPPDSRSYDIPIIGDDLAKIGRIIAIWADPCSPKATVWAYGFFQALPTLVASLVKPELIDINIRHRNGKPRKAIKNRFGIDFIFRDAIIEIPVPRWVVFRVYELSQRIGWYLLVADATEDFAINWMTLAYKNAGCQSQFLSYIHGEGNHTLQGITNPTKTKAVIWFNVALSQISFDSVTAIPTVAGKYNIGWTLTFSPYQIPAQSEMPYNSYLEIDNTPFSIGEAATGKDGKRTATGSSQIYWDGNSPAPTIRILTSWANGTGVCYFDGQLTIARTEDNELEPDP